MVRIADLFTIGVPSSAFSCIALPGEGKAPISVASETAVNLWGPKTQIQRFSRTTEFRNDGGPIDFFAPTPTPPKLTSLSDDGRLYRQALAELEGIVRPRFEDRKRPVYRLTEGWDFLPPATFATKSSQRIGLASNLYMSDEDDVHVLD